MRRKVIIVQHRVAQMHIPGTRVRYDMDGLELPCGWPEGLRDLLKSVPVGSQNVSFDACLQSGKKHLTSRNGSIDEHNLPRLALPSQESGPEAELPSVCCGEKAPVGPVPISGIRELNIS